MSWGQHIRLKMHVTASIMTLFVFLVQGALPVVEFGWLAAHFTKRSAMAVCAV
jgi:hypothetical protein